MNVIFSDLQDPKRFTMDVIFSDLQDPKRFMMDVIFSAEAFWIMPEAAMFTKQNKI